MTFDPNTTLEACAQKKMRVLTKLSAVPDWPTKLTKKMQLIIVEAN